MARRSIPSWCRLHVGVWSDDRLLRVSPEARWLYLAGLAYSADKELDGQVPDSMRAMFCTGFDKPADTYAHELVTVGLWDADGVPAPKWGKWQETREQREAERERGRIAAAESAAKRRDGATP